jgi:hypothetical protein
MLSPKRKKYRIRATISAVAVEGRKLIEQVFAEQGRWPFHEKFRALAAPVKAQPAREMRWDSDRQVLHIVLGGVRYMDYEFSPPTVTVTEVKGKSFEMVPEVTRDGHSLGMPQYRCPA